MTSNPEIQLGISLLEQFKETRSRTLELVKTLEKDDFVVQTAFFMSPPKWHIGHVSWIYEAIMSKIDKNYEFHSKEFSEYLNSYYQQFGVPHDKGLRGVVSRPTTDQVFQYFNTINQKMEKFIQTQTLSEDAIKLIMTGFHHECQHQELLVYDLQHLLAEQYTPVKKNEITKPIQVERNSIHIKEGIYIMGNKGREFCYDIELPEHKVYLNEYKIEEFPVTNQQYLEFMEDGGYDTYKYWLSDGWEKVKENKWKSPMYWEKINEKWHVRDFLGIREINPNEPVGSDKVTEFWAQICLDTKTAFVNCIPSFIASDEKWAKKFEDANVPCIGDDIKGQVGATIVHRTLAKLCSDRGTKIEKTYQINVGGNTDFLNMKEQDRLASKRISKTESVQSQLKERLDDDQIYVGPSDFIPFLGNTKLMFMRIEGRQWANIPYNMEVRLEVDDKANSAGIVIDAIRLARIALDRGIGGPIKPASAYLMKHPIEQTSDVEAKDACEKFVAGD